MPDLPSGPTEFEKQIAAYREQLQKTRAEMQSEYDKQLLILSSGALGLSITFIEKIVGENLLATCWLRFAWICWGFAICAIVLSYLASAKAMSYAIEQTDNQELYLAYSRKCLGGGWDKCTRFCNFISGFSFFVGVVAFIVFGVQNFEL